ncbi:MAG TPA: AMP-binding protein [Solirubrobacterales bacterium]|nr:AMP-binding protein [Solirubrobacterales bacterium]
MFIEYLDRGLGIDPGETCIVRADGSLALTHGEFADLTHRIAVGLHRRGLGNGGKVAVFAPNGPLGYAAVVGVIRAGAGWVALSPKSEENELIQLLALLECDFMIYSAAYRERAEALLARTPEIEDSVMFGDDELGAEFEAWLGESGERAPALAHDPERKLMFLGSGGTTGLPKAITVSDRQFCTMSLGFNAHMKEEARPTYLMATPMTHAAGTVGFPSLGEGGTIVVHDGVVPAAVLDSIERDRVTRLFLPPTAIYMLLADPAVRERDYSSLRHFLYAAAPMSADKLIEAIDVFGPVMAQCFGQSEAPMLATYMSPAEHAEALADPEKRGRLASCGRQSMICAVAIMDDDGNLLGDGEHGEIVLRGDLVMEEYYENPEATAEVRRPGGWHGTGDIGYRDPDGFFYIVDRRRDMIISGGFNVFPSEVERVIWAHDDVLDCAVIGIPDEKWGEAVTAVVELKSGVEVEEAELIALCKQELGSIKAPKAVHFRELPRSTQGKVLKRKLRDEFWAGHDRKV